MIVHWPETSISNIVFLFCKGAPGKNGERGPGGPPGTPVSFANILFNNDAILTTTW